MRRIRAFLFALLLVFAVGIIYAGPCANLTPDDWFQWWFWDCGKEAGGGGGGGVG